MATFVIIGERALPLKCAEYLLQKDHEIKAIITKCSYLRRWAHKKNIYIFSKIDKSATNFLKENKYDYLLSIDNGEYIKEEVIHSAKNLAINYHNSLLPKYAGLNACSWAILNGEKVHGITWHVIEKEYDTGDILKQICFPIESEDTALTLNLKCYDHALIAFKLLINDFKENTLVRKKQDLKERTYFSRETLVENNGFINFNQNAKEIITVYKALNFGSYFNELCLTKILIGDNIYVVTEMRECKKKSCNVPGIIVKLNSASLCISTLTNDIFIEGLCTLEGEACSINVIMHKNNLGVGDEIKIYNQYFLKRYLNVVKLSKKYYSYWIKQLKSCFPPNWPYRLSADMENNLVKISSKKFKFFDEHKSHDQIKKVICSLLHMLYFINGNKNFTVWYRHSNFQEIFSNISKAMIIDFPINTKIAQDGTIYSSLKEMISQLNTIEKYSFLEKEIIYFSSILNKKKLEKTVLIVYKSQYLDMQGYSEYKIIFIIDSNDFSIDMLVNRMLLSDETDGHLLANHLEYTQNIFYQIFYARVKFVKNLNIVCDVIERDFFILSNKGREKIFSTPEITNLLEYANSIFIKNMNNTAIIYEEKRYSYSTFFNDVNHVASIIEKHTAGKKSFIPIIFDRSYEMLVCLMAVIKTENAYVPIDLKYPNEKINYIIDHCKANFIFVKKNIKLSLNEFFIKFDIVLSNSFSLNLFINQNFQEIYSIFFAEQRAAYLIYTSGTTGDPKGVIISLKNILNYCLWFIDTFHVLEKSIFDFSSSIAFDISIPCMLVPILVGATVAICSDRKKMEPRQYLHHLLENKITHVECTPSYMSQLLFYPDGIKKLVNLEWLILGAETVIKNDVATWMSINPKNKLVNEYGPTECTVAVSYHIISNDSIAGNAHESVPIGRPIFNTEFFVFNLYGELCPVGVPGELYVSGMNVALGYFNNAIENKKKFINVCVNGRIIRCYATGDCVRWRKDKSLEYISRLDDQCKIMGFRVEPNEINVALMRYPLIQQSKVFIENDEKGKQWIAAYIIPKNDSTIERDELVIFIKRSLPSYMIPNRYYLVNHFPVTVNEKMDKKSLNECVFAELFSSGEAKESDLCGKIRFLLHKLLDAEKIGEDENLGDFGLDSIKSLELILRIEQEFNVKLHLIDILENYTINRLTQKIQEVKQHESDREIKIIVKIKPDGSYPSLFLIHPLGGGVFWYRHFSKFIDKNIPIIGLQDPDLEFNSGIEFSSFTEMATFYYNEIQKFQQEGPYYIAGASYGANLAVAIAEIMYKEKKTIHFVGLFDGWAHYPIELSDYDFFYHYILNNTGVNINDHYQNSSEFDRFVERKAQRVKLLSQHQQQLVDFQLTLFKADELLNLFESYDCYDNGWQALSSQPVDIYLIPGNHETMFELANVPFLLKKINERINFLTRVR